MLKEIYNRLMEAETLKALYPNDIVRSNHILSNQIFGISISEVSKKRATDNLNGFGYNIKLIPGYIDKIRGKHLGSKEDGTQKTMMDIIKEEFNRMKFDIVIGNPPYNKGMDLDFVNLGFDLSNKYCCMITPAKWQTAEANQRISSKITYGEFRKKLVPHMSHVVFYPDCQDVFDIAQVDGITISVLDKQMHDVATVQNICGRQSIFNTIQDRSIVHRESLLNAGNEIIDHLGNSIRFRFGDTTKQYQVWTASKISKGASPNLLSKDGKLQYIGLSRIIDSTTQTRPEQESTCSFSAESIDECKSFVSWLNCRLVRFLLLANISKLNNILTDDCFRFVPAPPSGKFDHIYTDQELYEHFKLPQKYIDVIEAVIKERK